MPTICLGDVPSDTGTYYYRCVLPYRHLRKPLAKRGITLILGPEPACDVYVYSQPIAAASLPMARTLAARGRRFVFGFDDHPWIMPEGYPKPAEWQERRKLRVESLKLATHVVVTTDMLRSVIGFANDREATVLPNLVDCDDYKPLPADDGNECVHCEGTGSEPPGGLLGEPRCSACGGSGKKKITVLFAGSPSHWQDVRILSEPIKALAPEYPDTQFLFFGCKPPPGLAHLHDKQVFFSPWVPLAKYIPTLLSLRPDVGLCPLRRGEFEDCKSNIKFLEMTLAGAACVTSNVPAYSRLCGPAAVSQHWWEEHISLFLHAKECREATSEMYQEEVRENASWQGRMADVWESFFVECCK